MPIPRIYTEDQFPLSENVPEDHYPEEPYSFAVLVDWDDTDEPPRQAVTRLSREVDARDGEIDQLVSKLRGSRGIFDVLNEFEAQVADDGVARRQVVHRRCGTAVSGIPTSSFLIGDLVTILRDHDCTVAARIQTSQNGRAAAGRAVGLLDGSDESMDPEYLRALAEMVTDAAGLPSERKEEVAAYLWEQASTTGTLPTI